LSRYRDVVVVIAAIAVAAAWVLIDHPLEGPVVLTLSDDHGVHLTDVLALVPLVRAWQVAVRD
jgi:hypothetical protein